MPEMSNLGSFLGLLPSVITGGMAILGIIYANWHNARMANISASKEYSRRRLDKLEDLYVVLSQYKKYVLKISITHAAFYSGQLTREQLQDQLNENRTAQTFDLVNARMLIDIYFEEASSQFEMLEQAWSNLLPLFIVKNDEPQSEKLALKVLANQESFDQVCEKLLSHLGQVAKKL
ncbi:hypothetical protein [Vibrio diazotrophicus]|uniref:hypothetical protein n=1 Tax=Vibrio diazotrophicus TaxID=685 RepID=UPI00142D3A2F|nr:hypothetical protein [Vibrio diazotrophicus]NIY91149.1 hypothetical protein [Vibrio diazotrophicus]